MADDQQGWDRSVAGARLKLIRLHREGRYSLWLQRRGRANGYTAYRDGVMGPMQAGLTIISPIGW